MIKLLSKGLLSTTKTFIRLRRTVYIDAFAVFIQLLIYIKSKPNPNTYDCRHILVLLFGVCFSKVIYERPKSSQFKANKLT
jgi:hypothetical protein